MSAEQPDPPIDYDGAFNSLTRSEPSLRELGQSTQGVWVLGFMARNGLLRLGSAGQPEVDMMFSSMTHRQDMLDTLWRCNPLPKELRNQNLSWFGESQEAWSRLVGVLEDEITTRLLCEPDCSTRLNDLVVYIAKDLQTPTDNVRSVIVMLRLQGVLDLDPNDSRCVVLL